MTEATFVEAPARLHFGVLDLRGSTGRRFGGLGAAAPAPTLVLSATRAAALAVAGQDAARAGEFARRFLAHHAIDGGAKIEIHRALPAHAGLGSGTQLALAVARALADIHGVACDAPALARAVDRGRRSAIGTWIFAGGGLVVEGGRRPNRPEVAPILTRLFFPATWRCVVAIPDAPQGISGALETDAFARLPAPPEREVERVSHLLVMGLLPALADGDLPGFGSALTTIQQITGNWWAPVQGGPFAPGPTAELVARMAEWGAAGVGQSSWGPAVYGIVEGEDAGLRLADRVRQALGSTGAVHEGAFRTEGARVWRAEAGVPVSDAPTSSGRAGR
jgi:beta-ribofuranosylaminobenzene 5'-phosphate synthase